MIDKLNKGDTYNETAFELELINHWFVSPAHTFGFASLLAYFMKDNEELTNNYYNYLLETKEKKSVPTLAANFANVLSFKDILSISRVKWFFQYMMDEKPEGYTCSQLIMMSSSTTSNLISRKSEFSCEIALNSHEFWFDKWLLNSDFGIRNAAEDFIYSLFPSYPKFEQTPGQPFTLPKEE